MAVRWHSTAAPLFEGDKFWVVGKLCLQVLRGPPKAFTMNVLGEFCARGEHYRSAAAIRVRKGHSNHAFGGAMQ